MTLTTYALLTDDPVAILDDHDEAPMVTAAADDARGAGTTARRRRRRRVRTAALGAGLAVVALAGTACEPQPVPLCLGDRPTIVGTAGDDTLRGTSGPDVITGLGGSDVVQGLGGNDRLCGGDGNDQVYAGEGNDVVEGGLGGDVVAGDIGTDTVSYGTHPTAVSVNLLTASGPDGDIVGTFENVVGSAHGDVLIGDDGPNGLSGGRGSDLMRGRGGADSLVDQLGSSTDRNTFDGGSGDDVMRGGPEILQDLVAYDDSGAPVFVNLESQRASGFGEDEFVGMDGAVGSPFADTIYGSPRRDLVHGGAGDDLLIPLGGDDTVNGGGGRDRVSFFAASKVNVSLATERAHGEGSDLLHEVEDVQGSPGADLLVGDAGPNLIDGAAGVHVCLGDGGADSLLRCP